MNSIWIGYKSQINLNSCKTLACIDVKVIIYRIRTSNWLSTCQQIIENSVDHTRYFMLKAQKGECLTHLPFLVARFVVTQSNKVIDKAMRKERARNRISNRDSCTSNWVFVICPSEMLTLFSRMSYDDSSIIFHNRMMRKKRKTFKEFIDYLERCIESQCIL